MSGLDQIPGGTTVPPALHPPPAGAETMLEKALDLHEQGFHVIPLKERGKTPHIKWADFQERQSTEEELRQWWGKWPNANIAIVTGQQINVVDADSDEAIRWCESGAITPTPWAVITGRGKQYYYRANGLEVCNNASGAKLDIRGTGGYVVAPGSIHENGKTYTRVLDESYDLGSWDELPSLSERDLGAIQTYGDNGGALEGVLFDGRKVKPPLVETPATQGERNQKLARLVGRWISEGWTRERMHLQAQEWNQLNTPPMPESDVERTVNSIIKTHERRNPGQEVRSIAGAEADPTAWPPPIDLPLLSDRCTDVANAHRFIERFAHELLHIDGIGWHRWDGSRWRPDDHHAARRAQEVNRMVLEEASAALARAAKEEDKNKRDAINEYADHLTNWARASGFTARVEAALKMAKPHLSYDAARFDADPWLLNCPNGTIDLRTGELREARPKDLMTKSTAVAYKPDASYEEWDAVVLDICCGDVELKRYIQRVIGYSLTGLTKEQAIFIFNGAGANGKDTLLNRVKNSMGDYAIITPPNLLIASHSERHETEIADLMGARLAIASESHDGGKLHETKVKRLTGSETLKARKMRQDHFEFPAQFKLVLMTNHRPVVEGDDHAIWRRIHLAPFNQTYRKGENMDSGLPERLDGNLEGVLRWAVEGCMEWQRIGLQPPPAVAQATESYRGEQDVFQQFLQEECEFGSVKQVAAGAFKASYESWCKDQDRRPMSNRKFWTRLEEKGVSKKRTSFGIVYVGVGLTPLIDG